MMKKKLQKKSKEIKLEITPATHEQVLANLSTLKKILEKTNSNSGIIEKRNGETLISYISRTKDTDLFLIVNGNKVVGYVSIWDGHVSTGDEAGATIEAAFVDKKYAASRTDLMSRLESISEKKDSW